MKEIKRNEYYTVIEVASITGNTTSGIHYHIQKKNIKSTDRKEGGRKPQKVIIGIDILKFFFYPKEKSWIDLYKDLNVICKEKECTYKIYGDNGDFGIEIIDKNGNIKQEKWLIKNKDYKEIENLHFELWLFIDFISGLGIL